MIATPKGDRATGTHSNLPLLIARAAGLGFTVLALAPLLIEPRPVRFFTAPSVNLSAGKALAVLLLALPVGLAMWVDRRARPADLLPDLCFVLAAGLMTALHWQSDPFSAEGLRKWERFLGKCPSVELRSPWAGHDYPFSTVDTYHGPRRVVIVRRVIVRRDRNGPIPRRVANANPTAAH